MQNSIEELWSLLHFLMPVVFDCSDDFRTWFSLNPPLGLEEDVGEALLNEEEKLLITNRLHQVIVRSIRLVWDRAA